MESLVRGEESGWKRGKNPSVLDICEVGRNRDVVAWICLKSRYLWTTAKHIKSQCKRK